MPRSSTYKPGLFKRVVPRRVRWGLIDLVGAWPGLYFGLAGFMGRDRLVDRDTDLVLEGFPRSANSFARWAMELANPEPLKLAHHRHVPAQVLRGVRLARPILVLIREPSGACASHAIFLHGQVPMSQLLRSYCRFYESIVPARVVGNGFEVATFEQVTSDFGAVIRRVNQRFGRAFGVFDHTPANVERCFELEETSFAERHGRIEERGVARPSDDRKAQKRALLEQYRSSKLARLRERAERVHRTFETWAHEDAGRDAASR